MITDTKKPHKGKLVAMETFPDDSLGRERSSRLGTVTERDRLAYWRAIRGYSVRKYSPDLRVDGEVVRCTVIVVREPARTARSNNR